MTQLTVKQRIARIMQEKNLTQSEFAEAIGSSQSSISAITSGKRPLGQHMVNKINIAFGINREWLLTGEGDMYATPTLPAISYDHGVPYYDVDFLAGFDPILPPESTNPDYLVNVPGYERATLWCNVSGHSMEPEINHGDMIALLRVDDFSFLPFGEIYGIITTNGMRTIKRLGRGSSPEYYKLIPTNREVDEQEIPVNKIAIVYQVLGAVKRF